MNARSFLTYLRQYAAHLDRKQVKPGVSKGKKKTGANAKKSKSDNMPSGETATKR